MKNRLTLLSLMALLALNGCSSDFESGLLLGVGVTAIVATGALLHNGPEPERPQPTPHYSVPYSAYRSEPLEVILPDNATRLQAAARTPRYLSPVIIHHTPPPEATPTPPQAATATSSSERWDWEDEEEIPTQESPAHVSPESEPEPVPSTSPTPVPVIILEPATTQDALRHRF